MTVFQGRPSSITHHPRDSSRAEHPSGLDDNKSSRVPLDKHRIVYLGDVVCHVNSFPQARLARQRRGFQTAPLPKGPCVFTTSLEITVQDRDGLERQAMQRGGQGVRHGTLLIHCVAGMNRSPVMTAAWLHRCGCLNLVAALLEIDRRRPAINPSPVLLRSVAEHLRR